MNTVSTGWQRKVWPAGEFKICWRRLACFCASACQVWCMGWRLLTLCFSFHKHIFIHPVFHIDKFVRGAEAGGLASRNKLHIYGGKTEELVVEIVRKSLAFLQRQFITSLWGGNLWSTFGDLCNPSDLWPRLETSPPSDRFISSLIVCCFWKDPLWIWTETFKPHHQLFQNFSLMRHQTEANNLLTQMGKRNFFFTFCSVVALK